jgi:hypothetical protein
MQPTRYFQWTATLATNGFDALSRYDANVDHMVSALARQWQGAEFVCAGESGRGSQLSQKALRGSSRCLEPALPVFCPLPSTKW